MSDAQTLTAALNGRWHGKYGLACCPAHGDKRPSLCIANGSGGKLLLNCKTGCGFAAVLDALRGLGLVDGRSDWTPPTAAEMAQREAEERAEASRRERQALTCWREAIPIHGTIAETYLRHRGITCDLPDTLRFQPECWHGATAQRLPAMIARVDGLPRLAVHRTWLRPDGRGKAGVEPNKAMLGRTAGGAVCVCDDGGPLVVAEGIETALSLSSGLIRRPATVWAALSAPGIAALQLPTGPHRLTIAPDGDTAGREAANKLAERAAALGWTVSLLPAPEGRDWNDILMMKGAAQ